MKKAFGVIVASALAVSGVAIAAAPSLKPAAAPVARVASEGVVQVNRGEGFTAVGSTAMVAAGDQVRLASSGDLVYGDGCSVQVAALDAFTVAAASPCAQSPVLTKAAFVQAQAGAGAATGSSAAGAGAGATAGAGIGTVAGLSTTAMVGIGAGLAAVVAGVAVAASDDDEPVSA
ncbi:hypothetical protein HNP32_001977 [Brevundimonas bullata]|uniref:Uncharacterized protein n=1 Tax=Brevundimonas bullata TaxID=13160 RepID=A0A7W7IPN0_9CAUL|nr:hypothetical protein [Brevundimonas bullata]MBB4798233.1 hypothetical protein [Brevundimonas bullata]MBB6383453.1 hypothetical protein [Brevundimonas bullata]